MGKRRKHAKVTCPCGCRRRFVKTTYNRKYATVQCKDRVAQRLFRERWGSWRSVSGLAEETPVGPIG